ncbi:MAG: HNH endonuclease, partial [Nitrosopumilus sp.]
MTEYYGPTLPISEETHARKYRPDGETFYELTARISGALGHSEEHRRAFKRILLQMPFMPAGRIQLAIGSPSKATPYNCFVSGKIEDSSESIMDAAKAAFMTMRMGGGIGYDFSNIRPRGHHIKSSNTPASGPVSFMHIYDAVCSTVKAAGNRRGAQMGVIRVDHPDIEEFISVKRNSTTLTNFNLSIAITDAFMKAVENKKTFDLVFEGTVCKTINAVALWEKILRSTWDWAEPGVLFIDQINKWNNLWYCETIAATNPCLHPDTLVETVNGRVKIKDITEATFVYTMDDGGKLGIAKATKAFISKRDAETIEIELNSGKVLKCTPNHLIYVDGFGWKEAQKLEKSDKIVHLCRARRGVAYSGVKLSTQENREYVMEHRFIMENLEGSLDGLDVHHKDGNTYNNKRSNLESLLHSEHSKYTALYDNPQTHQEFEDNGNFKTTGVSKKKIIYMPEDMKSNMKNSNSACIKEIRQGEITDVYDITVEGTHNFIANFMVVHNCAEQPLPEDGACLLGSFNMTKYVRMRGGKYFID